jgi:hypothetical protein
MAQLFPAYTNTLVRVLLIGAPLGAGLTGASLAALYRSPYVTGQGEVLEQPVPFSHKHHVSELGIDCRYCHSSVEISGTASVPPTKTCMNCHQQMWTGADLLGPVRTTFAEDRPIVWNKVHNLPHYVYFNHSIHIAKGVGCVSCHGQVDDMHLMSQSKTLLMEWCLKCHRNPEPNLRPQGEVFSMTWKPDEPGLGKKLMEEHKVRDATTLTSCSMCHR